VARSTISKGKIARWNINKVVGDMQVIISCQVKKLEEKGKLHGDRFTEGVAGIFGNEAKKSEQKKMKNFLPRRDQGWKGVRKAASMGQLL